MSQAPAKHPLSDSEARAAPRLSKRTRRALVADDHDRTTAAAALPGERPIDIPKRIRTASLCLNRILQEPGLTRHIRDFYHGIVMGDVQKRKSKLYYELTHSRSCNATARRLIDEFVGYVEYYSSDLMTMVEAFINLSNFQPVCQRVHQELVMRALDVALNATRERPIELGTFLVTFITKSIEDPDLDFDTGALLLNDWNARLLERLVQGGAFEMVLHIANHMADYEEGHPSIAAYATVRDIMCAFSLFLAMNESHPRRRELLPQLEAAIVQMSAHVGDDETDGEEEEEEEDDHSDDEDLNDLGD